MPSPLDPRDNLILADRRASLDAIRTPRVGDFVRFADGTERRISHLWTEMEDWGMEDNAQTSDGGSFYLGHGYVSFSGSLYGGTPINKLRLANDKKLGSVWFFHHDYARAHNGVDAEIPFRIYTTPEEAPR